MQGVFIDIKNFIGMHLDVVSWESKSSNMLKLRWKHPEV